MEEPGRERLGPRRGRLAGGAGGDLPRLIQGASAVAVAVALIVVGVLALEVELGAIGWAAGALMFGAVGIVIGAHALRQASRRERWLEQASPDPLVDLDGAGRIVSVNRPAERLLGVPADELLGRSADELVPPRLSAAFGQAARRYLAAPDFRSLVDARVAVLAGDGTEIPVEVTLSPRSTASGVAVRLVLRDVSERHHSEEALRHGAGLLAAAERLAGLGSWEWDVRTGVQRWSDGLYELFGLEPQGVPATFERFEQLVHPDDRPLVRAAGRRAVEQGRASAERFRIVRADGEVRVVEGVGQAVRDAVGETITIIGTTRDVTESVRAERELARAAAERALARRTEVLLEVTDTALAALGLDELLPRLLDAVSRALDADAGVALIADDGPDRLSVRATFGISTEGDDTSVAVWEGLAARVRAERDVVTLYDDEVALVRHPTLRAMRAVAGVPLLAEGEMIGVIEVGARDRRRFDAEQLALLRLAADRAALAVAHARLFARERHIADTLQHSLLPERLPAIPGVRLVARYRPAGDRHVVGGDFYDAFPLGDGRWLLLIGDVCGKGPEAAALTALVRYTIRAEALHEPRPGELLGLLNDAILSQRSDLRFCTALCCVLEPSGAAARMTLASGGHPAPLLLRRDGTIEELGREGGPLVGIQPGAEFPEETAEMAGGDALIAYTDGLIDAHAPTRILEPDDVAAALHQVPRPPLEELAAELEDRTVGAPDTAARDDVAILAVELDMPAETSAPGGTGRPAPQRHDAGASGTSTVTAAEKGRTRPGAPPRRSTPPSTCWLPATPQAPARARALIGRLADLDGRRAETAALLVSEAVTNSVRHAGLTSDDLIAVSLHDDGGRLRIEVTDHGPGFTAPRLDRSRRAVAELPERGLGLELVDALASRWGTATTRTRGTVWIELDR